MKFPLPVCVALSIAFCPRHSPAEPPGKPALQLRVAKDRIEVRAAGRTVATYRYRDPKIKRPYFTNLFTPDGQRVTRRHPPRKGTDSTDHATMHPGVWLAFGDLNGADFWRNKAAIEHAGFVQKPAVKNGVATFTVRNRYIAKGKAICVESCRHTIRRIGTGYLLTYDSTFRSPNAPLVFGDQEEMGLGVRVNDRLRVRGGNGEIRNSDGKRNEKAVRGTNAEWCLYGGTLGGSQVGVVLMPHPKNFRKSWYHARNYGFLAANPFGRHALTGGKPSRVKIAAGQKLRLRIGLFVHWLPKGTPPSARDKLVGSVYRDYVRAAGQ